MDEITLACPNFGELFQQKEPTITAGPLPGGDVEDEHPSSHVERHDAMVRISHV